MGGATARRPEVGAEVDGPVRVEVVEDVGVLTLAAPPANALTRAARQAILAALGRLGADGAVTAVAMVAEGRSFSAGLDVRELDSPGEGPSLRALCDAVERFPKPLVAVLDGPALGAGAELALAARWRLGTQAARMGFPDLALDLLPGGGATQRLPRIVGVEAALRLLRAGRSEGAEALLGLGLLDGVAAGSPVAEAASFLRDAASRAAAQRPPLPDATAALRAAARARAALGPDQRAERDLVDCVEASLLLPPGQGLDFEAERHADSLARPRARALRHLFLAERRASPALLRRAPGGPCEVAAAGEPVVERLGHAMGRAAGALARAGVPREAVDQALVDWGMPAGPFGGMEGGAGPGGAALVRRINAAVLAEAARLMAEGAASAGEVDALAVAGLGVPRASGGPVRMAEMDGLRRLCGDMEAWARADPVWAVPPPLAEAAERGTLAGP